jgi:hypothetical protein
MSKKTYRPKSGVENLTVDLGIPDTETGGKVLSIGPNGKEKWPYTTEDPVEQELLGADPYVTDQPEKKKEA